MKPKELRRRALSVLDKAVEECPKPEGVDLVLTAQQLLVAAEDIEDIARDGVTRAAPRDPPG
jgi:hypothetical protein